MPRFSASAWLTRLRRRSNGQHAAPATAEGVPLERTSEVPLPDGLFDLRDRLITNFDLADLRDLAFTAGMAPQSVPGDTRQEYALNLTRAAWCRGRLPPLLAAAAAAHSGGDWAAPELPDPPEKGCEAGPPRSIFSTSRQVATFLLILLGAAALLAAGWWWAGRPERMTSEFNIAVAAVDPDKLAGRADAAELGDTLQNQVIDIVNRQLDEIDAENTEVSGDRMPVARTSDDAAALAEQVNAQLVIYGGASVIDDTVQYTPRFYVALDTIRADVGEMQGEAALELPLSFTMAELLANDRPTGRTAAAATLITNFVRALANLNDGDIADARRFIDAAVARADSYAEVYGPFAGREVVYLFASQIARIQAFNSPQRDAHLAAAERHAERALSFNPNYGRAYIARANLAFDRGRLDLARPDYQTALALPDQPADDLIAEKANFGLGNVYFAQLLGRPVGQPCTGEEQRYADLGLGHYGAVIDAIGDPGPDERLRDMVARAYFYSGELRQICGQNDAAADAYRAALRLEPQPTLAAEIETLLNGLTGQEE